MIWGIKFKYILIIILILTCTILEAQQNIPTQGLVAHYPFNGNANDESGNGKHGTVHGATLVSDRFGNSASAYLFDGVDDYIIANNMDPDNFISGLSFGGWVKSLEINGWDTYFSWPPDETWGSTYIQNVHSGELEFRFGTGNSSTWHPLTNTITIGSYFFIFATHDDTFDRLYLNGSMIAEFSSGTLFGNADNFIIGAYETYSHFSNAVLDDILVYNRALTESEILGIYQEGANFPPDLISPIQNETITSETVQFSWSDVAAQSYDLFIDDDPNFNSVEDSARVTINSYTLPEYHLGVGHQYYWKVRANFSDDSSATSGVESFTFSPTPQAAPTWTPLYRLYHPSDKDHFYCTRPIQRQVAINANYRDENIEGYVAAKPFADPNNSNIYHPDLANIYRLYHNNRKCHYYTTDASDRNAKIQDGFIYEGVMGFAFSAPNDSLTPLYQLYKQENPPPNEHYFYTISWAERVNAENSFNFTFQENMCYISPSGLTTTLPAPPFHGQLNGMLNTANGNFQFFSKSSFNIPSRGLPLLFSHSYNSSSVWMLRGLTPLGPGWSHSYNAYVVTMNPGSVNQDVFIVWPDGSVHHYRYNGTSYQCKTPGVYDIFNVIVAGEHFTVKKKNQVVYTFLKPPGAPANYPAMLSTISDRNGNTITCDYESSGLFRLQTVTGPAGRTLSFNYHSDDRMKLLISEVIDNAGGRHMYFEYDSLNNLTRFIDARGQTHTYSYLFEASKDSALHLLEEVNLPEGQTIKTIYQEPSAGDPLSNFQISPKIAFEQQFGGPAGTVTTVPSADGLEVTITDAEGVQMIHRYETDSRGYKFLKEIYYPALSASAAYWREDANNPTLITRMRDPRGYETIYSYDLRGNLEHIYQPMGVNHHYQYNTMNDVTQYTNPRGKITTYGYDGNGNLSTITDPRGTTQIGRNGYGLVEDITNPLGHLVDINYNSYGNISDITDPLFNTTSYDYDNISRLIRVTNAKNLVTRYDYDNNDNLISVTEDGPPSATTQYFYDQQDRLDYLISARGGMTDLNYDNNNLLTAFSNPGQPATTFTYRNNFQLQSKTDPEMNTTIYDYDPQGRLQSVNLPHGTTFGYDNNGNITGISESGLGSMSFNYDALNRLTGYTDFYNKSVGYGYDLNGNITSIHYPGGKTVTYTYYDDDRLWTVKDWNNNVTTYTYRADGSLWTVDYPNGVNCTYSYDGADRVDGMTISGPGGTIAQYSFTLDALGNHEQESITQPLSPVPTLASQSISYSYDIGNRIQSAGSATFGFDNNGNMISKNDGGITTTYLYDSERRLSEIRENGSTTTSYVYDIFGNRRAANRNGITTRYVLDINGPMSQVLVETDAGGNVLNYYIYGLGLVSRIKPDGSTRYYHGDFRGSVVAMTDESGNITHKYAYGDFGEVISKVEEDANPFRYVGTYGVMDEENGLQFMRARYYDPEIGRFLSEDPVWDINLYSYAQNNPIIFLDPLGMKPTFWDKIKIFIQEVIHLVAFSSKGGGVAGNVAIFFWT